MRIGWLQMRSIVWRHDFKPIPPGLRPYCGDDGPYSEPSSLLHLHGCPAASLLAPHTLPQSPA